MRWGHNTVARDWTPTCTDLGLQRGGVSTPIPRQHTLHGFTCAVAHDTGCTSGDAWPVQGEALPIQPEDAVVLWNQGQLRFDWCVSPDDEMLPKQVQVHIEIDPDRPALWRQIDWRRTVLGGWQHINSCPWRRLLQVPVRVSISGQQLEAHQSASLIVTGRNPQDWTLLTDWGDAEVRAPAITEAYPDSDSPHLRLLFGTGIYNGHRTVAVFASDEGGPRYSVGGSWQWRAGPPDGED